MSKVKSTFFTKYIHKGISPGRKMISPPLVKSWKHFINNQVDIIIRLSLIFRWDGVGCQKSGDKFKRSLLIKLKDHLHLFEFGLKGQSIPGFHFHGGRAVIKSPFSAFPGLIEEFINGCCTGSLHGGEDPAAFIEYFHVSFAL